MSAKATWMRVSTTAIAFGLTGLGLVASGGKATAATFTVPGYGTYDITTVNTTFNDSSTLLQSQPWFGSATAANTFATTVGGSLGFPNAGGFLGPQFGYSSLVDIYVYSVAGYTIAANADPSFGFTYATATSAVVPEPSEVIGTLLFSAISGGYLLRAQSRKVAQLGCHTIN